MERRWPWGDGREINENMNDNNDSDDGDKYIDNRWIDRDDDERESEKERE